MSKWTTPVFQKGNHDCVIATIAMALDRDYDEVMAAALRAEAYVEGEGTSSEAAILSKLGLSHRYESGEAVGAFVSYSRGYYISPEYFRSMAWGRRAIMAVPSLNKEGGMHSIFWDGERVFDPNPHNKERYTYWKELKPESMIVFREDKRNEAIHHQLQEHKLNEEFKSEFMMDMRDLPEIPSEGTLIVLKDGHTAIEWPYLHNIGKKMQRDAPRDGNQIPFNTECEGAAGLWKILREAILIHREIAARVKE